MSRHYRFKGKVFEAPYAPHYESYRGHLFVIDHYHNEAYPEEEKNDHVWLKCVDEPNLKVNGYVELSDLQQVIFAVVYKRPAFMSRYIVKAFEDYGDAAEYRKVEVAKKVESNQDEFTFTEEAEEWYDQCYKIETIDYQLGNEIYQSNEEISTASLWD